MTQLKTAAENRGLHFSGLAEGWLQAEPVLTIPCALPIETQWGSQVSVPGWAPGGNRPNFTQLWGQPGPSLTGPLATQAIP